MMQVHLLLTSALSNEQHRRANLVRQAYWHKQKVIKLEMVFRIVMEYADVLRIFKSFVSSVINYVSEYSNVLLLRQQLQGHYKQYWLTQFDSVLIIVLLEEVRAYSSGNIIAMLGQYRAKVITKGSVIPIKKR